jgi:D-sedoheptulose 7-phosphate isomerase
MKTETDLRHCDDLAVALADFRAHCPAVHAWGADLAERLGAGARLLAAGNGGSAAQAQHLTAELVGRYRDERPAFSALALHADTSSTTAIANDYGVQEVFARQVGAHGRPGDVLVLLSTSGASANLLAAAGAARAAGVAVWALTGPAPNPLAAAADSAICVQAASTATVQELHLVAVHMLCESFDRALETPPVPARAHAPSGPAAANGFARVAGGTRAAAGDDTVAGGTGLAAGSAARGGAPGARSVRDAGPADAAGRTPAAGTPGSARPAPDVRGAGSAGSRRAGAGQGAGAGARAAGASSGAVSADAGSASVARGARAARGGRTGDAEASGERGARDSRGAESARRKGAAR